jgi:hypothetical protein
MGRRRLSVLLGWSEVGKVLVCGFDSVSKGVLYQLRDLVCIG